MNYSLRITSVLLCFLLLIPLLMGLVSCSHESPTENRVVSVTSDGEKIRIEATLTKAFLESYTAKKVYLFELPSVYSIDADLSELDPVAEIKAKEEMTVTLPACDGVRSRLYSSYLLASFDSEANAYTPLTPPAALTHSETAAEATDRAEVTIKGLIAADAADAIRLGAAHTILDVPMEALILSGWQEGAVSYVYGGVTRYLNADALATLDEAVDVYTAAGVEVYLRFTLGSPTGRDVPLGLYLQGAPASSAADYAVNMTTTFSTVIVEGFFEFMADRYASPDREGGAVNAFILGHRVNNSVSHNAAAGMELAAYVTNYEKLVRVAYTALVSRNADGRVYVAADGRRTVTDGQGWDTATFLAAFAREASLRGDYGWHVACELYADTPAIWEENPEGDSAYFTIRNLGVLTGLMDAPAYSTAGNPRRLLISGFSIPAVVKGGVTDTDSVTKQAASYAYAYLTCVQNGRVEALIYDTHVDPFHTAEEGSLRGLWTAAPDTTLTGSGLDLTLRPAATRPIYDVFRKIDTTEASTLSDALTHVIGTPYTNLESALAGQPPVVTFLQGTATLQAHNNDRGNGKAATLYGFNSGSTNGFTDGGGLTYLELVAAETLGINVLHARFDRDRLSSPMGLTVTLPATSLIGGKEMILDLYAGPMGNTPSTAKPTVTLRLTRASKGAVSEGMGEIRYEASVSEVKSASWQTASFDISAFTALLDASDEVTMTLVMDYPTDTAPNGPTTHHMGLAGVYVTGTTAASSASFWITLAIVAVLALSAVGVAVLLVIRHIKKKQAQS